MAGERIRLDDPDIEVVVRRSAQARRLTLSVPQTGAPPRVTVPPGVPLSDIRMFLLRQSDWLAGALERTPDVVRIGPGAPLPVEGRSVTLVHRPGPRRAPVLQDDTLVLQGGEASSIGPRVEAWLKERARAALSTIASDCAAALGARHGRISLRDTTGRWGSCTSRGDLSFSWRLAMAPHSVLDYVAAHEAAHLIEMNHGPRFWALVEGLRPAWKRERAWLKKHGASLHRYRFRD